MASSKNDKWLDLKTGIIHVILVTVIGFVWNIYTVANDHTQEIALIKQQISFTITDVDTNSNNLHKLEKLVNEVAILNTKSEVIVNALEVIRQDIENLEYYKRKR